MNHSHGGGPEGDRRRRREAHRRELLVLIYHLNYQKTKKYPWSKVSYHMYLIYKYIKENILCTGKVY